MSKEEDLLFCQIAIQTGMVNQADAKKCLTLAQKLENEGKRRPAIGTIFIKTNLISQQNVQKLQQAVRKRQQASGAPGGARATGRRAGARPGRGRARRARGAEPEARRRTLPRRGSGKRRVSQGTAWLYIGSGLVFLILIISMVYMLVRAGQKGVESGGAPAGPTVTAPPVAPVQTPAAPVEPKPTTPPPMDHETDTFKEFQNDHRMALTDSRQFMRDDLYGSALDRLRRVRSSRDQYYQREPELRQKMDDEIASVEKKIDDIVTKAITTAQGLAKEGNKSEAESILSDLKLKLGSEEKYVAKVDAAIANL